MRRVLSAAVALFLPVLIWSCGNGGRENEGNKEVANAQPAARPKTDPGKILYIQYCMSCHQENGEGMDGVYPPLKNSEYVKGDKKWLIKNVIYGQQGPITVNGKKYNNIMPPMDYLTDKEIATILTYVRKVFGEGAGPVSVQEVASARAEGKDA